MPFDSLESYRCRRAICLLIQSDHPPPRCHRAGTQAARARLYHAQRPYNRSDVGDSTGRGRLSEWRPVSADRLRLGQLLQCLTFLSSSFIHLISHRFLFCLNPSLCPCISFAARFLSFKVLHSCLNSSHEADTDSEIITGRHQTFSLLALPCLYESPTISHPL